MENKMTPGKPMQIPERDMHGPYEVSVSIRMVMPDGQQGSLTFYAEPGHLPTRAEQLAMVNALNDPAQLVAAGAPPGTRLLTKPEYVAFVTKRHAGVAIPMPGNQEYVAAGCEIPHQLLVHAIMGTAVDAQLADEYEKRGLLEVEKQDKNAMGFISWNEDLLGALPDAMLLAMYQRITAPAPEGAA